jgi:hypothetical protein
MKQTRKKHNAGFKAKVAVAVIKGNRTMPSWRVSLGFIRTRSTTGRSSFLTAPRVSLSAGGLGQRSGATAQDQAPEAIAFQTEPQIALDQIQAARAAGLPRASA